MTESVPLREATPWLGRSITYTAPFVHATLTEPAVSIRQVLVTVTLTPRFAPDADTGALEPKISTAAPAIAASLARTLSTGIGFPSALHLGRGQNTTVGATALNLFLLPGVFLRWGAPPAA